MIHGDCLEILKGMADNSVDAVITDPPYDKITHFEWDVFDIAYFNELLRVAKNNSVISFANFKLASKLFVMYEKYFRYDLIWHKTRKVGHFNSKKMPMRDHEIILIFGKPEYTPQKFNIGIPYYKKNNKIRNKSVYGNDKPCIFQSNGERHPGSVLRFKLDTDMTISSTKRTWRHPTQKPLSALEWIVKSYTNEGDTILDPFAGSGTTGVACAKLGRQFIGIEKEEEYFRIAQKRIEHELTKQKQYDLSTRFLDNDKKR